MKDKKEKISSLFAGAVIGLINGFFGGGGGMVLLPFMTKVLKKETKIAHATAILVMLPISVVSSVTYLIKNNFNFKVGIFIIIGFVLGGLLGALALKNIKNKNLTLLFAFVMGLAGVKTLFF